MNGAATFESFSQRAEVALQAGCDMLLVCNQRQAVVEILDHLPATHQPLSEQRLLKLSGRFQLLDMNSNKCRNGEKLKLK